MESKKQFYIEKEECYICGRERYFDNTLGNLNFEMIVCDICKAKRNQLCFKAIYKEKI